VPAGQQIDLLDRPELISPPGRPGIAAGDEQDAQR
jgi:hypothetical protein